MPIGLSWKRKILRGDIFFHTKRSWRCEVFFRRVPVFMAQILKILKIHSNALS